MSPSPRDPESLEDKRCSYVYPEDHPTKAGERCAAFRTMESVFCNFHGDGVKKASQQRQRQAKRRREVIEAFNEEEHDLTTMDGIAAFQEKLAYMIISKAISPKEAGQLINMLPHLKAVAKERKPGPKTPGVLQILQVNAGDAGNIAKRLTGGLLDAFLNASEADSVKLIEQLHEGGHLENNQTEPEKTTEVIDLFALCDSGETELGHSSSPTPGGIIGATNYADPTGFDHLWTEDGQPLETKRRPHKWKKKYVQNNVQGLNMGVLHYVCEWCGFETTRNIKATGEDLEDCPTPQYGDLYEEIEASYRDEA